MKDVLTIVAEHLVLAIHAMAMVLGLPESEIDGLFALQREEKALLQRKLATLFPNGHPWG